MFKILLAAKSEGEGDRLSSALNNGSFSCIIVNDAESALHQINFSRPDLFLIETSNIPESERFCRIVRDDKKIPVVAVVPIEAALSLDGTVDDFVLSPVNTEELAARIKRLLHLKRKTGPEIISIGNLLIDTVNYEVHIAGRPVSLTFREYELLRFLAMNPGRAFTRDALLNGVWGEDFFGGDRTVDVHIRRLRSKIENETTSYIETVRNIGYRFIKKP
jgi:two-component system alkaline phosphatase synthesis response regulator PhoP